MPSPVGSLSRRWAAAGLGYGLTYSLMYYGSLLSHANGRATLYTVNCEEMSVFVLSGEC